MTPREWLILAFWTAAFGSMLRWMYAQVKRVDEEQEKAEKRKAELLEELRGIRYDESKGRYVMPENEWQQNARRAEALGFMDDNDPRAA